MQNRQSILNILCYELPGFLTRPMFNEYESIKRQIIRIWEDGYQVYLPLKEYERVVYSLLAVCIYYRYVLGSMSGASDFYAYLNKKVVKKKDCEIRCGEFRLNQEQYNKLLSVNIAFNRIRDRYQISDAFFEFSDTIGFLRNCLDLLNMPENIPDNPSGNRDVNHEDYPF